jgi:hypothetical protein
MIPSRETNTLLAVKRSGNVSQLFGKCPNDVRQAIKEEKAVTKVVTTEKRPDDQLPVPIEKLGGADRVRTDDLLNAIRFLVVTTAYRKQETPRN